ncbi:abortive infection system antitoxin AbiGi family protein [Clostridium perfringens]
MNKIYLSASTLFHFTNNIDNIINILEHGFSPRYCMEKFNFIGSHDLELAIPMVCFCDIPLSQIGNHIENYGGYAIGLDKEWGIYNGINPVTYSIKNAIPTETISQAMDCFSRKKEENSSKIQDLLAHFIFFMKPYEGQAWNKEQFNGKLTRFYDEREWRYIPNYEFFHENKVKWYLKKDEFLDHNIKIESNNKISEVLKLKFNPNDIKYIVVSSEEEILDMCKLIDNIKGDKYSLNELNVLKTRIISKERILNDF